MVYKCQSKICRVNGGQGDKEFRTPSEGFCGNRERQEGWQWRCQLFDTAGEDMVRPSDNEVKDGKFTHS